MNGDDDYIYDEDSGEWITVAESTKRAATANTVVVKDSAGNILANCDSVITIKDLKVKGAGQTLRRGTVIKTIHLTDNPEEIDCRYEGIKGLVLRTEFVRKH
jgi:protein PhnA